VPEPLRVAIVGTGGISRYIHIPAYKRMEARGMVKVVALCDTVPAALAAAASQFGVERTFTDYRDAVGRSDIDVVSVATPNAAHEPVSIAALNAGKHVLCEKPLALDYAGALRMLEAARKSGKRTAVHFRYRFIPSALYLKELVETGELGDIYQAFLHYFQAQVHDPHTPARWRQSTADAGGMLGDIGSHILDLAMWILGPIARVHATSKTFTKERSTEGGGRVPVEVDDATSMLVEFASGTMGVLCASGLCQGRGNHQRAEIYGTKGSAIYEIERMDSGGDALQVCFGAAQARTVGLARAPILARHQRTADAPFAEFIEAINADRDAPVTFADAVRVQEVIDAAKLSAATGNWVSLPVPVPALAVA